MVAGEKDEQLRFQARLLDAVGQSVIATDLEGKVLYWNRAAEEIYGWSSEEALGRRLRDLTVSEGSLEKAEEVGSELRAGRAWSGETLLRRKDGSYVTVLGTATPLFDDRGNVVGMIGVSTDISERKALEEQLHHQAFHDPLTGLPNRALFMDRLEHAFIRANRRGTKVAVLFMDLDNFKVINDSLGHKAGDLLLIAVAERLKAPLRPEDTVARLGGDEFTILVEDVASVGDVARIAGRIATYCDLPLLLEIRRCSPPPTSGSPSTAPLKGSRRISCGTRTWRCTEPNIRGKARYEVFEPSMDSAFTPRSWRGGEGARTSCRGWP